MTLHNPLRLGRKMSVSGLILASIISTTSPLLAQETLEIKREARKYGAQVHELRQRMITDPATSGEIKDYGEVRKFSYDQWMNFTNKVAHKPLAGAAWQQVTLTGSQSGRTSGRARTIAFHPTDPKIVWIGTAQGGIFRTNDVYAENPTWVNLSDNLPSLAMGAIAVDPKNPNIIFAGTGETVGGYSTPGGAGLFRSNDGGLNWKLVLAADSGSSTKADAGYNCSEIVIDPKNSNNVFVATGNNSGFLKSTDGGNSWRKTNTVTISPVSIEINPDDPSKIYTSGQNGKVLRSTDGGETWTECKLGSLTSTQRIQLGLYAKEPNTIYAAVLLNTGMTQIYRSTDHGVTWTLQVDANGMSGGSPDTESLKVNYLWNTIQGNYAHSLAVDPNTGNLLAGGLIVVYSNDGGKNLRKRSQTFNPSASDFVHADIQHLAYNIDGRPFCLSDGGISYSTGASGISWVQTANKNLGTLQFVGVDADRQFNFVIGGTQDNGTNRTLAPKTDLFWTEVRGGDGGMTRVAQEDPSVVFGTSVGGDRGAVLLRSNSSGTNWLTENLIECNTKLAPASATDFYPRYDISANGTVVAIAGRNTIFVDAQGGTGCFPVEGKVGTSTSMGSRPLGIHIAPYNEFLMWAGVSKAVLYTEDQGENWTKVSLNNFSGVVYDITSDITDPKQVYAVSSGAATALGKNFARSKDGGKTWEFPATTLPSIPMWSIAKAKDGKLYIGSDFGVLVSADDGNTWLELAPGLPKVQVLSLDVRGANEEWLLAGTYGRGAYYIDRLAAGGGSVDGRTIRTISLGKTYPNPVTAAANEVKVDFELQNSGTATMTLHDIQGRELMTLAKDHYPAGSQTVTIPVSNLEAGTYFYTLVSDGQTISDKFVVSK
ncbi:MAG TPA: YCF48-related protein [Candidatus Kapabacteria bacterium]|nr:YCF48-related protein [Candidatus Kapabacteria bacterium]